MSRDPFIIQAQPLPDKDDKSIVVACEGFFQKIMCAPKTATQEEVEQAAGPSGTTRGWKFEPDHDDACIQCKDDPDRVHWMLWC